MNDTLSRRALLQQSAGAALAAAFGAAACNKAPPPLQCTDTTGLSAGDIQVRQLLLYTDTSPEPAKTCSNCSQFIPNPAGNACGACKVVKGPIHPGGHCKTWLAKPA
jgi:phosphodiesterase/alkaline phosphatase D-like protein